MDPLEGKNGKDYCQGDSNKNGSKVSKNLLPSKPEGLLLEPEQGLLAC